MSDCPNEIVCCSNESSFIYSIVDYPVYRNDEVTIFVPCPQGFVCQLPGTWVTIPAGTIEYRPTDDEENEDAEGNGGSGSGGGGFGSGSNPGTGGSGSTPQQTVNNQATQSAIRIGNARLSPEPSVFFNNVATAECLPGAIGGMPPSHPLYNPATGGAIVRAGTFSSPLSQAAAQARAQLVVNLALEVYGDCHWLNTEQSYTAYCEEEDRFGPPVTRTTPAGDVDCTSDVNQDAANECALAKAQQEAIDALVCYDFQNSPYTATCPVGYVGDPVTKPAGTYFSNVSQADADMQAQVAAEAEIQCVLECADDYFKNLTWNLVGSGTHTESASGFTGEFSCADNSSSGVNILITNPCGSDIQIQISMNYSLQARTINFIPHTAYATIEYDSVVQDQFVLTTVQCGNALCDCETETGNLTAIVTIPATDVNVLLTIGIASIQSSSGGCNVNTGDFEISILT